MPALRQRYRLEGIYSLQMHHYTVGHPQLASESVTVNTLYLQYNSRKAENRPKVHLGRILFSSLFLFLVTLANQEFEGAGTSQ